MKKSKITLKEKIKNLITGWVLNSSRYQETRKDIYDILEVLTDRCETLERNYHQLKEQIFEIGNDVPYDLIDRVETLEDDVNDLVDSIEELKCKDEDLQDTIDDLDYKVDDFDYKVDSIEDDCITLKEEVESIKTSSPEIDASCLDAINNIKDTYEEFIGFLQGTLNKLKGDK